MTEEEKKYSWNPYQQGESVTQAQKDLQAQQAAKPGPYQSQWQGQLKDLTDQYLNRPAFSYDVNADALWNQYKDQYVKQGQMAMMDTMGQAAAMTGGYGNSYAQTVGQQTYQGYLQGLNAALPEFYRMAMNQYQMEGDQLMNQYGMVASQEEQEYGRYMDSVNQYYEDLDRAQGRYDSERNFDYGKWDSDRNFGYSQHRDNVADEQWQKQWDEDVRRYNYEHGLGEYASTGGDEEIGGESGGDTGRSVEDVYVEAKQSGASSLELDAYLKQCVSEGRISQREATDLREKRW